jgi:hypothetical protein
MLGRESILSNGWVIEVVGEAVGGFIRNYPTHNVFIINGVWEFDSPEERLRQRIGFWQVGIHQSKRSHSSSGDLLG